MTLSSIVVISGVPIAVLIPVVVAMQDMQPQQQWTVLGILVFVLASIAALLRSQGRALVQAVRDNTKAQGGNTAKLTELVTELKQLVASNARWKGDLLEGIERVEKAMRDGH